MWKKIVMRLFFVLLAICLLAYFQLQRVNTLIAQRLQQHHVTFQQMAFSLYPTTQLTLSHAQWNNPRQDAKVRSIFAEKLHVALDFWSLWQPQNALKAFRFEGAKLWGRDQETPELSEINGALTGEFTLTSDRLSFLHADLDLRVDRPLFLNTTAIQLRVEKGLIQRLSPLHYQFQWHDVQLNGELFPLLQAQLEMASAQGMRLVGEIGYSQPQPTSLFSIDMQAVSASEKRWQVQTENLVAEQWLNVLNLPKLIRGATTLSGEFRLVDNQVQQGAVQVSIPQGELNGINLLTLVANYVPINVDAQQWHEKRTQTAFERLKASFTWHKPEARLNALSFQTKYVAVDGQGHADLASMQCDIRLNVSLNQPEYAAVTLPIHFFDHCQSPRYKVEFNKPLRHQLKDLLKQKFR